MEDKKKESDKQHDVQPQRGQRGRRLSEFLKNLDQEDQEKKTELKTRLKAFFETLAPGRSIRELAASLEIDFSYLAKVLRGEFSLTESQKEIISRYFFLPLQEFEKYLHGEIDLSHLKNLACTWKLQVIDFSKDVCPAWKAVLRYADDESWLQEHQARFVENICVFLAFTNLYHEDKEYLAYLKESLSSSPEKLRAWLSSLESPPYRRAVFHALLFTVDPVGYAVEKGLLYADAAFRFKEPDRHIRYPEFSFRLVQSRLEE